MSAAASESGQVMNRLIWFSLTLILSRYQKATANNFPGGAFFYITETFSTSAPSLLIPPAIM
jgi:hypothetical protein